MPDNPNELETTNWKPILDAQELFDVLTKEGQTHYRQAAETPLVKGPFAEKIGPFDNNEYCNEILSGTFNMNDMTTISEVKELIKGMRYPDPQKPTPIFNSNITDEEFFKAIFNTRESTSLSPSGRHYGHYHMLLRDPGLLGCITSIANFCFTWGVTL